MSLTGLARVRELYQNRDSRARELRGDGNKVIGYFCCYAPLEMMTAAGLIPYRIMGTMTEPITRADAYLETIMCPFIRSCFDLAVKGQYDFLDGLVVPHTCDTVDRIYNIWRYYRKPAYSHYVNVPHMVKYPSSYNFFRSELETFKRSLEAFTGSEITPQRLRQAIELHNENRAMLRKLCELRREDPPLLSGTEMTQIVIAGMTIPLEEYRELLKSVLDEVINRRERPARRAARILIYGAEIDDTAFIELVEESGANVVIDDHCMGTRHYWHDVEMNSDPLDAIAARYLERIPCPRTYRKTPGSHQADLENRFGYLRDFARDFNVNGVIMYVIRFCDTHEIDAPDVRDYLQGLGLPVLHLEEDYSTAAMERLKTRVQAFTEMIG